MERSDNRSLGYWNRKGGILMAMLDEICPITEDMPQDVAEAIDIERQMLVMQMGWNNLEPHQLEAMWLKDHDSLPYSSDAA